MEKKVGTSVQRIIKFGILAGFSALYSRPSRPLKKNLLNKIEPINDMHLSFIGDRCHYPC